MSTVAYITARGLFGRRRALLLLPLPLLLIGLALICRAYDLDPLEWGPAVVIGLGLAVVLPVIALIVGRPGHHRRQVTVIVTLFHPDLPVGLANAPQPSAKSLRSVS